MEDVIIICLYFISTVIFLTLATLFVVLSWRKKNPWWRQNDHEMRLSPAENCYRQNERHKINNLIMVWFLAVAMILGIMVLTLRNAANSGTAVNLSHWLYALPFVCMALLALSGMHWRK